MNHSQLVIEKKKNWLKKKCSIATKLKLNYFIDQIEQKEYQHKSDVMYIDLAHIAYYPFGLGPSPIMFERISSVMLRLTFQGKLSLVL